MATFLTFGEALRDARQRLKLTQVELARRVGLTRRTVARWDLGTRVPDAKYMRRLVMALHALDPLVAEDIAKAANSNLVALGVVRAKPVVQPTIGPGAVDAVLLAAAEAMDASPRVLRPVLLATLKRMKALGVSVDAALREMEPPAAS